VRGSAGKGAKKDRHGREPVTAVKNGDEPDKVILLQKDGDE